MASINLSQLQYSYTKIRISGEKVSFLKEIFFIPIILSKIYQNGSVKMIRGKIIYG
jgi:hypothetical protein